MAMRVFYSRHALSPSLLWASVPFYSLQSANSFVQLTYTNHHIGRDKEANVLTRGIERHRRTISFLLNTASYLTYNSQQRVVTTNRIRQHVSIKAHPIITTRLFGSNPTESNVPGEINLSDERDDTSTIQIDMVALHKTIDTVRDIIGYPTYDINCQLIDDEYMKEINTETRGVDTSTDVLSFCFTDCVQPGVLEPVPSHGANIGEMYCLGDLLVCVDYVARRCDEDKINQTATGEDRENNGVMEAEVVTEDSLEREQIEDDGEYEYQDIEVEVLDEWDDRGVAPALLTTYDPEVRIHMLIVHGMLHLVGYDHIEDDDYELMVVKEDEVMAELKRRLGRDFGLGRLALSAGNQS